MPSLAFCLPRMMLPQVAGSIWVVSLGAKQCSVELSAGEAAGVGGSVLYQMHQGSQKMMKASITEGGKSRSDVTPINISIYLHQIGTPASRAADSY